MKVENTTIKMFTIKELSKVEVPDYQRWIVPSNQEEIKNSVTEVGMLRCPVIFYVKSLKKNFIIDGNHLKNVLIEIRKRSEEIPCIYKEVQFTEDAVRAFVLLNTKGKKLDLVDFTHLYRHTTDGWEPNVYKQVWAFLGNPDDKSKVKKHKLYSVPTIVEIVASNKKDYINGESSVDVKSKENYIERVAMLEYLIANSYEYFKVNLLEKGFRMPSGAAMIGFLRYWLGKDNKSKMCTKDEFLRYIVSIYQENNRMLRAKTLVINRDNAGRLLKSKVSNSEKKRVIV